MSKQKESKISAMGTTLPIAPASMIAIGCDQYRICHIGMCPKGIATQDINLRKRFSIEKANKQLTNYFEVIKSELEVFGRITGYDDIHELTVSDLITTSSEISNHTNIPHA